jgi:NADPH:quinone reductase-like Zn-dependent oxidoreductase
VIDYKTEKFEEEVSDADVVFDCIGGDVQARSWQVLRRGGVSSQSGKQGKIVLRVG